MTQWILMPVPRPNILIIVMDTARADIVSDSSVMPSVHRLSSQGCEFTQCFANAPWTLPSHASIFTGKHPSNHGVIGKGDIFQSAYDLPSILGQHGYVTVAFSNNPWISPDFGFDSFSDFVAGWKRFQRGSDLAGVSQREGRMDQLHAILTELMDHNAPFTLANALYMRFFECNSDSGAKRTTNNLLTWLDNRPDEKPFFAFVNYMEPHLQYDPPSEYARKYLPDGISISEANKVNQDPWAYLVGDVSMTEQDFEILRSLYRGELSYLDNWIDTLIRKLSQADILDETAVFILGDHGENIGDHGLMDHQYTLRDTLLHVPLIARYPPVFESGSKCDGFVELRDLYPTILELAEVPVSQGLESASEPLQSLKAQGGREYVLSEYLVPQPEIETLKERYSSITTNLSKYDRRLRSIRTTDYHYILDDDGQGDLFETGESGVEQGPINYSEVEAKLKGILQGELGTFQDTQAGRKKKHELSEANQSHLEDLGYL